MTVQVSGKAAYVSLVPAGQSISAQSAYLALLSPRQEVSSTTAYLALIDTNSPATGRRRQMVNQ